MTYDEAVRIAREAAMALPLIDHGSTEAIHDTARLLIAAYRRGRIDAVGHRIDAVGEATDG